jgi:hypothetical protein
MTREDMRFIDGVTYKNEIMTIDLGNGRIRRFGLASFDRKYGYYVPVPPLHVSNFLITDTKKEMIPHAKRLHYAQNLIIKIGSPLRYSWGLQCSFDSHWFLLAEVEA